MLPCFVVGGNVAHPKWWVLTLCCTWLHSTQWNESCNLTHRQDKTSQIMNENTGPARNTVAGPIFFLVSSLAGFFSRQRERCLPGGGGGAGSQECHELISTPSHIENEGEFILHICSDCFDCFITNKGRLTGLGNSLKNHCSVFRICFQNPEL